MPVLEGPQEGRVAPILGQEGRPGLLDPGSFLIATMALAASPMHHSWTLFLSHLYGTATG